MRIYDNGVYRDATEEELEQAEKDRQAYEEWERNRVLSTQEKLEMFADMIKEESKPVEDGVTLPPKEGYIWQRKMTMANDVPLISWELVEDPTYTKIYDGTDYTRPITYKPGMSVTKGLWYTDGSSIWECLKDGTPTDFSDKEYFDIIE